MTSERGRKQPWSILNFRQDVLGRQCVIFTGYRVVMANKAVCVWMDAVEVA